MPVMSPLFRQINYSRICELRNLGYSASTIACIINDESNSPMKITEANVHGYLAVQAQASARMLISKQSMEKMKYRGDGCPDPA